MKITCSAIPPSGSKPARQRSSQSKGKILIEPNNRRGAVDAATVAAKLKSGQPLNAVGISARFGYSPPDASTVTLHGSVALFTHGLCEVKKCDSFGVGYY